MLVLIVDLPANVTNLHMVDFAVVDNSLRITVEKSLSPVAATCLSPKSTVHIKSQSRFPLKSWQFISAFVAVCRMSMPSCVKYW